MKQSSLFVILSAASAVSAAVATEYAIFTDVDYAYIDVLVDGNGAPLTTAVHHEHTLIAAEYSTITAQNTYQDSTPTTAVETSSAETSPEYETAAAQTAVQAANVVETTTSPDYEAVQTTSIGTQAQTDAVVVPTTTEAESTTSVAAAEPTTTSSSGSGQTYSGDATFYEVGLGACGVTNTDSDLIAAMNWQQFNEFGSMSNGNPICGKQAILHYQDKSVTVTVEDKCPGCSYGSIDLSPAAFNQLADESLGRIQITWEWI